MNLKILGIASIATVLTACSTQPTQPLAKTAAPAASVAPAATAAPAAASASASAKPAAAATGGTDANGAPINRTLVQAGYKPTTVKGEVFYCRSEMVTNTAFKKKVCLNESQIADEEKKIKALQQEMMRRQANPGCMGPGCGG